ncbi:MAG TPA: hypothetical protein VK694_03875 [Verrucomicrobiae bacterium]|nr:hypothetical protein [Verrucomicrobiae bacterium]
MADKLDFSGTWKSTFEYVNKLEPEGGKSEYDIKIHQMGNQLVLESIATPAGNYFVARLSLDDHLNLLTGNWQEDASPGGAYKGQAYYGVGMLKIDPDGTTLRGKIVEYNNDVEIISGDWEVTRTDKTA